MAQQPTARMDSILKDTFNIPFLQEIVETYFCYYHDFPNTSSELIRFSKKIAEELTLQFYNADKVIDKVTLPKLRYYEENLCLNRIDARSFDILLFDTLLTRNSESYNILFYPCDIAEYAKGPREEYRFFLSRFRGPIYYNEANEPIIYPDYVSYNQDVKLKLRELEKMYIEKDLYRYLKDCRIPLKTFYEYRNGSGLFFYCTQERVQQNCIYFEELEKYLSSLCKEIQLGKLIFLAPEL